MKVGDEEIGVMMGWERDISRRTVQVQGAVVDSLFEVRDTVEKLCGGLDGEYSVLNVGFGLGIVCFHVQVVSEPTDFVQDRFNVPVSVESPEPSFHY